MFYFDNIIKLEGFYFNNILVDQKSYESILIYYISYETLIGPQALRIRFDEIDGFIKTYDENKYLVLRGSEKYDAIYNRIRYLIV